MESAVPAAVDRNLLRHQMNTEEYSCLQKVIDTTPSTASVNYPALQRESEMAASAVPIVAAPPVVFVMQQPPVQNNVPPPSPPKAASSLGQLADRLSSLIFQAGHNPDPVKPPESKLAYAPKPVQAPTPQYYQQHAAPPPQFIATPGVMSPMFVPTYGSYQHPATLQAQQRTMTMASAPPPESPIEPRSGSSAPYFSMLQEVSSRAPVERLLRFNCNAGSVLAAGMTLSNFYEANYTLREVARIFPTYNELVSVGLNKYFFEGRWNIRELSEIYHIELRHLISASGLALTPADIVGCKLTPADLKKLGITVPMLQEAGADFMFWSQLKCTPAQFTELGGTVEHVAAMRLTAPQREVLSAHGWNYLGVQVIKGLDSSQAVRLWPIGFQMK